MADTTFVDKITVIPTAWLQDLNDLFYKGTKSLTLTTIKIAGTLPSQGSTPNTSFVDSLNGQRFFALGPSGATQGAWSWLSYKGDGTSSIIAANLSIVGGAGVFTVPTIDSGTTGSLSFKLNNGEVGFQVIRTGVATNFFTVEGTASGAPALRAAGADTDVTALYAAKGAGNHQWNTGAGLVQFQVLHTASSNRNITITGSNGGNPTIGVTAGSLAITPTIVAAAGQITFPATQNPSADVNTLDDYEEGTWTPGLSFGSATTGITYNAQNGGYIKIGKLVILNYSVTLTSKGSAVGIARLTGFPFTVATSSTQIGHRSIVDWITMTSTLVFMDVAPSATSTEGTLRGLTAAATIVANLTDTDFNNATTLQGAIVYMASA